jgi:hypothetical protein
MVQLVRPFLSTDVNDTNLTATNMDFAWAYGPILGGAIIPPSSSDEGTTLLDLSLPSIPPSGALIPGPIRN